MKVFNSAVRSEEERRFNSNWAKMGEREADCSEMDNFVSSHLIGALCSIKQPGRRSWRSPEITMSHCHTGFCYKSLITKRGSDDYSIQYRGLQAAWGSLIKKIQLFVYIHFPHSDYFINCPAFISSLPTPLIISSFIQSNKHTIGALWIQRICFPLSKSRYSLMIGQRQASKQ